MSKKMKHKKRKRENDGAQLFPHSPLRCARFGAPDNLPRQTPQRKLSEKNFKCPTLFQETLCYTELLRGFKFMLCTEKKPL